MKKHEIKVKNVKAHGNTCIGCVNHKADVMVSYTDEDGEIIDLFLTTRQAEDLRNDLKHELIANRERR